MITTSCKHVHHTMISHPYNHWEIFFLALSPKSSINYSQIVFPLLNSDLSKSLYMERQTLNLEKRARRNTESVVLQQELDWQGHVALPFLHIFMKHSILFSSGIGRFLIFTAWKISQKYKKNCPE